MSRRGYKDVCFVNWTLSLFSILCIFGLLTLPLICDLHRIIGTLVFYFVIILISMFLILTCLIVYFVCPIRITITDNAIVLWNLRGYTQYNLSEIQNVEVQSGILSDAALIFKNGQTIRLGPITKKIAQALKRSVEKTTNSKEMRKAINEMRNETIRVRKSWKLQLTTLLVCFGILIVIVHYIVRESTYYWLYIGNIFIGLLCGALLIVKSLKKEKRKITQASASRAKKSL